MHAFHIIGIIFFSISLVIGLVIYVFYNSKMTRVFAVGWIAAIMDVMISLIEDLNEIFHYVGISELIKIIVVSVKSILFITTLITMYVAYSRRSR